MGLVHVYVGTQFTTTMPIRHYNNTYNIAPTSVNPYYDRFESIEVNKIMSAICQNEHSNVKWYEMTRKTFHTQSLGHRIMLLY
jgi:hypothetical protein